MPFRFLISFLICNALILGQYTVVFPTGVVTDADLGVVSFRAASTLAAQINSIQTTLQVQPGHGALFAVNNFVIVDSEKMLITSKATDVLTVARGLAGTTAALHTVNTPIVNATLPDYHNRMAAEMKAVQANVLVKGNNLSDVTNTATARTNLGAAPLASPTFTGTVTGTFSGNLTGNATTATAATALSANAGNCAVNEAAGGVSATGAAEACVNLPATYQSLDQDLTGIASLAATAGMLARTGAGTFTARTLTGTANEISIANSDGASGVPTFSLAPTFDLSSKTSTKPMKSGTTNPPTCSQGEMFFNTAATAGNNMFGCTATNVWSLQSGSGDMLKSDNLTGLTNTTTARSNLGVAIGSQVQAFDFDLLGLAGLTGTGLVARTTSNTFTERALTGTANQITVTNADGVSGNPTISIPTSPTFITPTIASFANAVHTHTAAAGGGTLGVAAHSATGTPSASTFLRGDNTWAAPAGSGTVSVVGAGALTSTALVTGGGSQALQTPAATATMDSGGNISTPGTVSSGAGSGVAGTLGLGQGTAPSLGTTEVMHYAPAAVTSYGIRWPGVAGTGLFFGTNGTNDVVVSQTGTGTSGQVLTSNGAGTVPTFQTGGGGGAPVGATYITKTADATLTAEQALSSLASGVMKVTTGTGDISVVTGTSTNCVKVDGTSGACTGGATSERINVITDYGATGNGSTNDATAIQNAINAAQSGTRKEVFFPKGDYNLGSTGLTVLSSYVALVGDGTSSGTNPVHVRLKYTGTGTALTIGFSVADRFTGCYRNVVRNIVVDISGTADTAGVHGIKIIQTYFTKLEDVEVFGPNGVVGANRVGILFDGGVSFGSGAQLTNVNVSGALHYGIHFNLSGFGYTGVQIWGGSVVSGNVPKTGSIGIYMQRADTNHFFGVNIEDWETGLLMENAARFNHIMARMEANDLDWKTTRFSDWNFITGSFGTSDDGAEFTTIISQSPFQGADHSLAAQNQKTVLMNPILESAYGIDVTGGRHGQVGSALNFRFFPKGALQTRLSLRSGNILELNNGTTATGAWLTIPQIKSTTGVRYVCVDTTGKLVSQTTACSGT